jgi:hypothetical protein
MPVLLVLVPVPLTLAEPVVPRLELLPFTLLDPLTAAREPSPLEPLRLLDVPRSLEAPMPLVAPTPFDVPMPAPAAPLPESESQPAAVVPGNAGAPLLVVGLAQSGLRCVLPESNWLEPAAPLPSDDGVPAALLVVPLVAAVVLEAFGELSVGP